MSAAGTKRKVAHESHANGVLKRRQTPPQVSPESPHLDPLRQPHPFHHDAEENGIVLRKYYPQEMSNARAMAYSQNQIPRPIERLQTALAETAAERRHVKVQNAVVHWFKMDLRMTDNRALFVAYDQAREARVPLITMYILSPQDFEAHLTAPVRIDFMLRTLEVLKKDLAKLDIPLYIETVGKRKEIPRRIVQLMSEWGANHLYANLEYEVDELRREADLVGILAENGMAAEFLHDTCVVAPGELKSGSGNQYAVYSPWFRAWVAHIHENPEIMQLPGPLSKNHVSARKKFGPLFDSEVPDAPIGKRLSEEEQERFRALWPAGEHEAQKRLELFCKDKVGTYEERRNFPAEKNTSSLSVHFASGTLSARTAIRTARDHNTTRKLDGGSDGIKSWIREVAWRDFYKHVLVNWPYVCMNKPFKPEYSNISWSYDRARFQSWCEGRTGFPIVDAAMRQLREVGWMHNRCRMIVASFLAKDLLIDWRMGERFFMEHLIDGDFASNNGGWGFAASVGADPQPYFRIFNPLLQSEKFDADGEYIRRWVPELKDVEGKAIHDPYGRGAGAEAKSKGYPEPIVEHKGARERALNAYKEGIGRNL